MSLKLREKSILQSVIHEFIMTANPIGSKTLAEKSSTGLAPASIRKIMANLEEEGYLAHPHTSAGRIPTTKGYRFYVDEIINQQQISNNQKNLIQDTLENFNGDVDHLMDEVAGILAAISRQLSIVVTPKFYHAIFENMQIVPLASDKWLVIMTVSSGQVKTILLEVKQKIKKESIKRVLVKINQRFCGKTLFEIRKTFAVVMEDFYNEETGLIRLFTENADRLFDFSRYENYSVDGTRNIINQPEFSDISRFSSLIEMIEDKDIIIHFMGKREDPPGIKITIGHEHDEEQIKDCSVITSTYRVGNVSGVVGVIGPTRMAYGKVIPLVDYFALAITQKLNFA
ncbi:MAG: heat-inducible transcriptional repressor HrcA [Calditrichaceae bacterium]